jgi:hypothetical protein
MRWVFLALLTATGASADVCGADDLSGSYGFLLSGTNTISGTTKPSASIGRLNIESGGAISGTSSVNFNGLFLGNPVTGKYTFQTDCSFTFELQDTSGGWQHFRGTLRPGGARGDFRQTDPGTGLRGELHRLADSCAASAFRGKYGVTILGRKTVTIADGNGALAGETNSGTYTVDPDCFVDIKFGLQLRGILVDGGRTVLAVQSDPLTVSTATFTAQ